MINVPKGTKDVLPDVSYKWQYLEKTAREVCALFDAREIRTPVFEHTELFIRSIGADTDVVGKEMYTFTDKGGRSLTLKPEGTAPVARSFVENSLEALSLPLKMFYITPVFRYERPQAGRLREHHQFGVEFYGSDRPETDFEVINLAYTFLSRVGIKKLSLNLNSLGCRGCRARYNEALKRYLAGRLSDMCSTCRERYDRNPLRILDCKEDRCRAVVGEAPKILDYLCDDCRRHLDGLSNFLSDNDIPFIINAGIVRGLDYYTRTVFEFVTDMLGAQGTVCGGGRYDGLVESVGGKPTPCVGFGLGLERLLMLLDAAGTVVERPFPEYFVMSQSPEYVGFCLKLVNGLRAKGISAQTELSGRSLKAQFKYADKLGVKYSLVVGESELVSGIIGIKNMADGTVREISLKELTDA